MHKLLIAWLVVASFAWWPMPTQTQPGPFSKLALNGETQDEYRARRESIMRDIDAVAFDPAELPVIDGPDGRAETALFLDSIASFESGYDLLVDNGKQRGPGGEVCVLQVMVDDRYVRGVGMVTREGWSASDLLADRKKCIRAALHKLQASRAVCTDAKSPQNATHKALAGADAFSIYTGGRCSEGSRYAKNRYDRARVWLAAHPVPSAMP